MSDPASEMQRAIFDGSTSESVPQQGIVDGDPRPVLSTEEEALRRFAVIRAALIDMTAAYHSERKHPGRWRGCQQARCQNARLAIEGHGRGTARYRALTSEAHRG